MLNAAKGSEETVQLQITAAFRHKIFKNFKIWFWISNSNLYVVVKNKKCSLLNTYLPFSIWRKSFRGQIWQFSSNFLNIWTLGDTLTAICLRICLYWCFSTLELLIISLLGHSYFFRIRYSKSTEFLKNFNFGIECVNLSVQYLWDLSLVEVWWERCSNCNSLTPHR